MPMIIPISTGMLLSPLSFLDSVMSFPIIRKTNSIPIDILLKDELKGTSVKRTIDIGIKTINKAIRYNTKFKLPFFIYNMKSNLLNFILLYSFNILL